MFVLNIKTIEQQIVLITQFISMMKSKLTFNGLWTIEGLPVIDPHL